jgi:hypothetical protein
MKNNESWLEAPLGERLRLVAFAALGSQLLIYLVGHAIAQARFGAWTTSQSPLLELGGAGVEGLALGAGLFLAAWCQPRSGWGWIGCALGGGALGFLIQHCWSIQQALIALGVSPFDYSEGLSLLLESYAGLWEVYGGPRFTLLLLAMVGWSGLLLHWGWGLARGFRGFSLLACALVPIAIHSWILNAVRYSIFDAPMELGPVLLPTISVGFALGCLTWVWQRRLTPTSDEAGVGAASAFD